MWFRIADGGSVINGATPSSFLKGQQKKLLLKVRALCRSYMKANICFRWAAPSSIYIPYIVTNINFQIPINTSILTGSIYPGRWVSSCWMELDQASFSRVPWDPS
jgi:hypothetical protein